MRIHRSLHILFATLMVSGAPLIDFSDGIATFAVYAAGVIGTALTSYSISTEERSQRTKSVKPPALAEFVLRLYTSDEWAEALTGDLSEQYAHNIATGMSQTQAARHYRKDFSRSAWQVLQIVLRQLWIVSALTAAIRKIV